MQQKNDTKPNNTKATQLQIGKRIKLLRQIMSISQSDLASAASVTFQQIQKYESGKSSISIERLQMVADFLSAPLEIFFEDRKLREFIYNAHENRSEGQASSRYPHNIVVASEPSKIIEGLPNAPDAIQKQFSERFPGVNFSSQNEDLALKKDIITATAVLSEISNKEVRAKVIEAMMAVCRSTHAQSPPQQ